MQHAVERLAEALRANPADMGRLEDLESLVRLARTLPFEVDFWKVQNAYYQMLGALPGRRREAEGGDEDARKWVDRFLELGKSLMMKVDEGKTVPLSAGV